MICIKEENKFAELNDDVLFGEVWSREEKLHLKMSSIVTISALVGKGMIDSSFSYHLTSARDNGVTKTEMVQFSGEIIEPCKACWACGGKENCVHKKDIFQEIFEKMKQADGIVLGSPVYTANISANMQAFLERAAVVTDMNRDASLLRHKAGAAVAAARRGGALNTLDAMNHFFMLQNMYLVGSSYWPMAYGQIPGDVLKDEEGLNTMKVLGQNMAYLLKALEERQIDE